MIQASKWLVLPSLAGHMWPEVDPHKAHWCGPRPWASPSHQDTAQRIGVLHRWLGRCCSGQTVQQTEEPTWALFPPPFPGMLPLCSHLVSGSSSHLRAHLGSGLFSTLCWPSDTCWVCNHQTHMVARNSFPHPVGPLHLESGGLGGRAPSSSHLGHGNMVSPPCSLALGGWGTKPRFWLGVEFLSLPSVSHSGTCSDCGTPMGLGSVLLAVSRRPCSLRSGPARPG